MSPAGFEDMSIPPSPRPMLRLNRSPMIRMSPALFTAAQDRVSCDQRAVLQDGDLVGEGMDLNHSASRGIRNALGIATDADHALPRHAALQLQNGFERC